MMTATGVLSKRQRDERLLPVDDDVGGGGDDDDNDDGGGDDDDDGDRCAVKAATC